MKNVFDGGADKACEEPWQRARAYMKQFNTTPIKMDAENIVMSGASVNEEDISITLSRIQDTKQGDTLIFMDLQCKDSPQGQRFCNSNRVEGIKEGFQKALSGP